jgi:hypothetical protein
MRDFTNFNDLGLSANVFDSINPCGLIGEVVGFFCFDNTGMRPIGIFCLPAKRMKKILRME